MPIINARLALVGLFILTIIHERLTIANVGKVRLKKGDIGNATLLDRRKSLRVSFVVCRHALRLRAPDDILTSDKENEIRL